jgi:mono/diheme cytochrome c family protein
VRALPLAEPLKKWRSACAAGAALALAAVAAGCGGTGSSHADVVNGKKLFIAKCGACHTLAHASSKGTVGPNLDDAFANSRAHGFGDSVIEGVVKDQIGHPRRGSVMPAGLVSGDDRRDVASYVGLVAGKPGQDSGLLASVGGVDNSNKTAVVKAGKLTIPADPTGQLAYQFGKATAKPGKVTFSMPNQASIQHNIAIKGPVTGHGPIVGNGGDSTFSVTLKPGKYEFYCQVPGHEQGGMKGTLTVK